MNRLRVIILLLFLAMMPAFSQGSRLRFGGGLGAGTTNWQGKVDDKSIRRIAAPIVGYPGVYYDWSKEFSIGYAASALAELRLFRGVSIQSSVRYASKGIRMSGYIFVSSQEYPIIEVEPFGIFFNYVQFPLLLILNSRTSQESWNSLLLIGGWYWGEGTGYVLKVKEDDFTKVVKYNVNNMNYQEQGYIVGIGSEFYNSIRVIFEYQKAATETLIDSGVYNSQFTLNFYYLL